MRARRIVCLILGASAVAGPAAAEELFVTQLRLPARDAAVETFAWREGGAVLVPRGALTALGVEPPASAGERVALESVAGLSYVEDAAGSGLVLTCAAACFSAQRIGAPAPSDAALSRAWGAYLNYDVDVQSFGGAAPAAGAAAHVALFGPLGVGESGWLFEPEGAAARLETRWTFDAPAQRLRLRFGDSSAPALGGGVLRFGGVQIGSHFPLSPSFIAYPTLMFAGEASSASSVELYVDGVLRARDRVEAGPFVLDQAPAVSGAGDAQLVVTDRLGQIIHQRFFASPAQLRAGLADWTLVLGAARESLREYGAGFAAARYRLGLTRVLTLEAGADASAFGGAAQAGVSAAHPWFGFARVGYAESAHGDAYEAAWFNEGRGWSAGVQWQARGAAYESLGAGAGPRTAALASLSLDLGAGALSVTAARVSPAFAAPVQTISIGYAPEWRRGALDVRVSYAERGEAEWRLAVSYSFALRGDGSGAVRAEVGGRGAMYRAGVQRAPAARGGFGWRASANAGAYERLDAAAVYRGAWGDATVQATALSHGAGVRLGHAGSVGIVDGQAFAGRRIDGAFALVDVGASGVTVRRDRLDGGRTGASGRLLAVNLQPYADNVISIDAEDLPLDRALERADARVRPAEGAGVLVRFPAARTLLQETRVRDGAGLAPARGGVLIRLRDGARFPIGAGGRAVISGAADGDVLHLEGDGRCTARADAAAVAAGLLLECAAS